MKKFLIISTRDSFLIKGLSVKLEQNGFTTDFVSRRTNTLTTISRMPNIISIIWIPTSRIAWVF